MSFFFYDIIFLIAFCTFLVFFLVSRRKKLQKEGILILYKTQLGIRLINYFGEKYKKLINSSEYIIIFFGYALMAGMLYLLFNMVYLFMKFPAIIKVIKIPPLMPLIPYIPSIFKVDFLPPFYFTYWIVVLAITAIVHEFSHGILGRARGVKIKSTGFAFLGPFTGAFVEPDENKVKKLKTKEHLALLASGSLSNLLLAGLFFLIMWLFFVCAFTSSGAIFTDYTYKPLDVSSVSSIDGYFNISLDGGLNFTKIFINENGVERVYYIDSEYVRDLENIDMIYGYEDAPALKAGLAGVIVEIDGNEITNSEDLVNALSQKKPYDNISIKTLIGEETKDYEIQLAENPADKSRAYLGIALSNSGGSSLFGKIRNSFMFFKDPNTAYKAKTAGDLMIFIYNLIWWVILINFSVALVNMLPLGIFDGGKVFYLSVLGMTKSEKIAKTAYKFSTYLLLFVFLLLTYLWFIGFVGL